MNYSDYSDFEINKRVGFMSGSIRKGKTDKHYEKICPDYCNNPSDAWPIIFDNKINLFMEDDTCCAAIMFKGSDLENYAHQDKNPLRSAMIVYLMMQESQC